MSSVSSQPHSRDTQPPSKVLLLRSLPCQCAAEELVELGKPFGTVVDTKCNVGQDGNQALIEFEDLNQAIAMVSYYASSSEPARVRGKTVYLQYSDGKEIVYDKGEDNVVPGNVLLVTIESEDSRVVSIDVLHRVFSAFGFVHKLTTFKRTSGFQALVQFSDTETASSARTALNGRSIPSFLLPKHTGQCSLRISYSVHTDLSVTIQSPQSRDYTNPYLPVAASASSQITDGNGLEHGSNILFASFSNMQYIVSLEVLHTVFSAFGHIQKITMFYKNGQVRGLIQYPDVQTAAAAKEALEGHCIYEGGFCKLHITYSCLTDLYISVNDERSRDYTLPNPALMNTQPGPQTMPMQMNNQQPYMPPSGSMPRPNHGGQPPYMPPSGSMPRPNHGGQPPYMPPSGSMPRPNHGG